MFPHMSQTSNNTRRQVIVLKAKSQQQAKVLNEKNMQELSLFSVSYSLSIAAEIEETHV